MRKIIVKQRKLSSGEVLENKRKAQSELGRESDTITVSEKLGNSWYKFYQIKKGQH